MPRHLCLRLFPIRFYQNQRRDVRQRVSCLNRPELVRVRPFDASPLYQSHNESNFTAICEPWSWCWPEPPKAASPKEAGHPAFNAGAAGETNKATRSDRLCASWELPRATQPAPGLPGVYSSAVSASYTSVHDRDPTNIPKCNRWRRAWQRKPGKPIKLPSYDQVRREVHRLKDGAGTGGNARRGQIASSRARVCRVVCALHSGSGPADPGR